MRNLLQDEYIAPDTAGYLSTECHKVSDKHSPPATVGLIHLQIDGIQEATSEQAIKRIETAP